MKGRGDRPSYTHSDRPLALLTQYRGYNHGYRRRDNEAKGKLHYPLSRFLIVVKLLIKLLDLLVELLDFLLQLPNFDQDLLAIGWVV